MKIRHAIRTILNQFKEQANTHGLRPTVKDGYVDGIPQRETMGEKRQHPQVEVTHVEPQ